MVSARGKVLRDSEVTARDLSFKSVWRELKAEGWTRKPPPRRSLEDRYKYIRPMGHANGTVGIDFFLGEEGVLEYYANVLRSRAAASARASNVSARQDEAQAQPAHNDAPVSASGQAVRDRYVEEVSAARRRQAEDTTNTLKQRRSNFCRDVEVAAARGIAAEATAAAIASASTVETEEAESDAAAWQTNPAAAFFGGPAPTTPTRSRPVSSLIATSPHIDRDVLEVADDDTSSVATADDDTASVATADDDSAWVPTADVDDASVTTADDNDASVASIEVQDDDEDDLSLRGSELLADNNDSLNAVNADENEEQYGAIESGDEAENDDVDTGEYDSDESESVRCMPDDIVDDLDETESEVAEEVFFAEKFLESFGGSDQVLAGNLKDAVLRSMTATGWEDVEQPDVYEHMMTPYEPVNNSSSYPGLRQGYSGPTAEALRRGDSPMALFFFFLPVVLWQHIA
uniref:Uncharacterized protein n=1 Tax=Phytophthora ramorum TaxID=164328 RepID=H3H8Y9_PHYRM